MSDVPRDPPVDGGEGPDDQIIDDIQDDEFEELPGDDGAEPPEADEDPEGQAAQPPARPSRGESRQARLARESREYRERAIRAEAERDALRTGQTRQPPPDPEAQRRASEAELERLRNMDPIDAINFVREQERRNLGGFVQQQMQQLRSEQDQRDYRTLTRTDKAAERLSAQVEDMVSRAQAQGSFLPRQTAFELLYGQEMLRRRGQAAPRQRTQGQRRIAAQTTQPGSARSDGARGRQRGGDDYEGAKARVNGQALWE